MVAIFEDSFDIYVENFNLYSIELVKITTRFDLEKSFSSQIDSHVIFNILSKGRAYNLVSYKIIPRVF